MVSFLPTVGAGDSGVGAQINILGCLRVAIVGAQAVGKTTLVNLLTGGPTGSCKPTTGCSVSCLLVGDGAGGAGVPPFLVELWDLSGAPVYADLRRLFYRNINGVILVHDLTDRRTKKALPKLAAEVATEGVFLAPFPEAVSARNIGGLPVPVLVIGNKADRIGRSARRSSCGGDGASAALLGLDAVDGCAADWAAWLRSTLCGGQPALSRTPSDASTADLASIVGLEASAATAQLDVGAVHAFLEALWVRRYAAGSAAVGAASGRQYVALVAPSGGEHAAAPATAGVAPPPREAADKRLDDDEEWV